MSDDLRCMLREGTRDLHQALDRRMGEFMKWGEAGYGRFLEDHARVLPAVESALSRSQLPGALGDWPSRTRTESLRLDLASLGRAMPDAAPFQEPASFHVGVGMLYTLEGSRLGGAWLLREVERRLPTCTRATRFLKHGLAERHWTGFLRWMEEIPADPRDRDHAVEGARAVFQAYLAVLDRRLPSPAAC
ncbi:MAG: biliverdin-producing heme oxygenase [Xanthomonadales bacterium]|nr:biliverdin-producing heme oxygenase [Xanthomonadales bacterium]